MFTYFNVTVWKTWKGVQEPGYNYSKKLLQYYAILFLTKYYNEMSDFVDVILTWKSNFEFFHLTPYFSHYIQTFKIITHLESETILRNQ